MNKIGLVTCYFHPNYGSMLQAYATQKFFDDRNIECENICIDGIKKEIDSRKTRFYMKQIYKPEIFKGTFLRIVKRKVYRNIKGKTFGRNLDIRSRCFNEFKDRMFKVSKRYKSINELSKECVKYSSIIVGSDQLWLPSNIEADYYTLSWVPQEVNKVAYSTSFGIPFLPEEQQIKAKEFLSRFQNISVREKSGQDMIKKYADIDVPVVCDPTLLFTGQDWMCIQKKDRIVKEKYILCYFLGNNKMDREFAKRLREKTGFKIVALLHLDEYIKADESYADFTPYDIGPSELLNLIRNSEYVVTDSFHGTVFSILYGKQFFTSRRVAKKGILCTNNRLDSLFETLSISGRLIEGNEDVIECLTRKIDYDNVYKKLQVLREKSIKYLEDSVLKDDYDRSVI